MGSGEERKKKSHWERSKYFLQVHAGNHTFTTLKLQTLDVVP